MKPEKEKKLLVDNKYCIDIKVGYAKVLVTVQIKRFQVVVMLPVVACLLF